MPKPVMIALLIELLLVVMTTVLMAQPEGIFGGASARVRAAFRSGGMMMLCLTFAWSMILGCLVTIHQVHFRF